MNPLRRILGVSGCALAWLAATLSGHAWAQQAYPSKPIRFIVPYAPGGSTSNVVRLVSEKLSPILGQPVIVDNRPGGNTVIGSEILARSAPDGHTILLAASTHVINPYLLKSLPYDPLKDFIPVTTLAATEFVLEVHPSVPANTLAEFIKLAKSKPGQLNYGTVGTGGLTHLAGAYFDMVAGTKMTHVPYKGTAPMLTDLLGGQLQLTFDTPISSLPHIKAGKLRPIAISGKARLPVLPQVPTFAEAGLDFDMTAWFGVFAPAGTPKDIVNRLATEIGKILAMPDIREKMQAMGSEPLIMTHEQFDARVKADYAKFGKVIKEANIKIEQ